MTVDEVEQRRAEEPAGRHAYERSPLLREVVELIRSGFFSPEEPDRYRSLMEGLLEHDEYMVFSDFDDYVACHGKVSEAYLDEPRWRRMSALNIARLGRFSSDRTIREYARDIWDVRAICVPAPVHSSVGKGR